MSSHLRRTSAALLVLLALYVWGIPQVGLLSQDEPRYAEIGYEMARDHQWVTPRLWGEPWFEKPAFLYWMTGAAYRLGFDDNWAPRLPVALLCVIFLFFYYKILDREFGSGAAFWSAGLCATSAAWLAYGQLCVTDMPLAVFFSTAVLLTLRWLRTGERQELPYAGVCLGLAVLAKGLVPIVLALPVLWVGRRRWRDLCVPALICLLVAVPWYAFCTAANGSAFLADFFGKHHFQRFSSAAIQHVQRFWYYIPVLAGLLFPWTPLTVRLPWRTFRQDPRTYLLFTVLAFGFLFFSAATNKLPGYLLPLLPACFALIGVELARKQSRWLVAVSIGLLGLLPFAAALLPMSVNTGVRQAWRTQPDTTPLFWLAVSLTAACLYVRLHRWPAGMALAGAAIAMLLFRITVYRELDRVVSVRGRALSGQGPVCRGVPGLRRAELYGYQFYRHAALPPCPSDGADSPK